MMYLNCTSAMTNPVVVPAKFMGLRSTKRSTSNVAAGYPFQYDAISNLGYNRYTDSGVWDGGELLVKTINPSAGVYFWNTFDRFMGDNPGKDLLFLLGFPADYLVSTAAVGGAAFGGKSNMCPTDPATYAAVCAAIASRAKNTFGITGAKWCLWGEMDTPADYAGTYTALAACNRQVYQAIKAVDSTAVIIAPSVSMGNPFALNDYLLASDGASGTGLTWAEGVAFDPYQDGIGGTYTDGILEFLSKMRRFKSSVPLGASLPVYIPETGIKSSTPLGSQVWTRRLICAAALGVKQMYGFGTDETGEGYDMRPFIDGWNRAYTLLGAGAGATISALQFENTLNVASAPGSGLAFACINNIWYPI